jgi:hypothetical protein
MHYSQVVPSPHINAQFYSFPSPPYSSYFPQQQDISNIDDNFPQAVPFSTKILTNPNPPFTAEPSTDVNNRINRQKSPPYRPIMMVSVALLLGSMAVYSAGSRGVSLPSLSASKGAGQDDSLFDDLDR